jgi:alpha-L-rhamnosidase
MRSALIPVIAVVLSSLASAQLTPAELRVESLANPIGVDVRQPRFSWQLSAPKETNDQRQSAYRIVVASSRENLDQEKGDLWDSGKVASDETLLVPYAGTALKSHQSCVWKAQAWDQDDKPGPWSAVATWSVGLLEENDFAAAKWIGFDKPRQAIDLPEAPFAGVKWIGFEGDKPLNAPKGRRWFLKDVTLPEGVKVKSANVYVTGDDRFWLLLNGEDIANNNGPDAWKIAKSVDITHRLKPGVNHFRAQLENGSDGPSGLLGKIVITAEDGKTIDVKTDETWRCIDKPGPNWNKRDIAENEWPAAKVVANFGDQPWGAVKLQALVLPPPRVLRTTFHADKPVKRATVYATALGLFDLHLNGQRVAEDRFNPGWTDYNKRVYYRAYDVTPTIKQGANALGAVLGDGWYSGYIGWGRIRDH